MLTKVYDGTPAQEAESLCESCRHARIIRGRRLEEVLVFCNLLFTSPVRITFKVTSCSDYADAREPGYQELLEKAWILRPATRRRAAGFVRASDLDPEERLFEKSKE